MRPLLTFALLASSLAAQGAAGRYATVNGLRMYYEVHGAGRPLVLIHGGGSTIQTSFGRVLPALARRHRVIAVELQSAGRTGDRDAPLTFEQDADDVDALLRTLGVAGADVFGFSNGANTAMRLAMRHPERVRRLVLASGFFQRAGLDPQLFEGLKQASPANMPPFLAEAYRRVAPDPAHLPVMVAKHARRMLDFTDWSEAELRAMRAPALVIGGDRDVVTVAHLARMAALIPGSELAIMPGADHGAYLGEGVSTSCAWCPGAVVSMVERFLAGADGAEAAGRPREEAR